MRGINDLPLAPHARRWPFDYSADERRDLGALLERHYPDPDGRLFEWSRPFLAPVVRPDTRELLTSIAAAIKAQFAYETREAEGTQTPDETLRRGAGSCRDFALLMIEVVRRLGMAARFVSGYLYDAALDGDTETPSRAPVRHTPGCMSIFPAPGGCPSIPPTRCSAGPA